MLEHFKRYLRLTFEVDSMKKNYSVRIILALLVVLLASIPVFSSDSNAVIDSFWLALRNDSVDQLRQIIAPNGLLLVRSHNNNRDQDLLFRATSIPVDLQIPAPNGLAFDLKYLFGGFVRGRSLNYLKERISGLHLNESSIQSIRSFAQKVMEFTSNRVRSYTPTVVDMDGQYMILTEAEANGEMMTGSMAVFVNHSGNYYLRLIIDLR